MTPSLPIDRTLLAPGARLCIALSGGADSVALLTGLHALNALPREGLGAGLSAMHIHHGIRAEEADGDAAFVEHLCMRLGIPLTQHRVDVPGYAHQTGETLEEAARTLRYRIFHAHLADGAADAILTAHTLDDQAETVLMKLLRGAWTAGLSGVHPVLPCPRGKILRPLLGTSRTQIVAYLHATGQPWREDSTNHDLAHTRNRLRHHVLPLLRAENPALDRTLANLAELARDEEAHWQAELARSLPHLLLPGKPVRGGGRAVATAPGAASVALEIERLRTLDPAMRRRVLRAAVSTLGVSLSFEETARLLALCGFVSHATVSSRTGAVLELAHGLRAERSTRELRLARQSFPAPRT